MKNYAKICQYCGEPSGANLIECPHCGTKKEENIINVTFIESLASYISKNYSIFDNTEIFINILFQLGFFLFWYLIIPQFVRDSYIFLGIVGYFTSISLLKSLLKYSYSLKYILYILKYLGIMYLGAGIGSVIANTGFNKYSSLSEHFFLNNIILELKSDHLLFSVGIKTMHFSASSFQLLKKIILNNK